MLEDFLSYIVEELSVKKTDKILLAASGGIDSMVMIYLFQQSDYYFEVAHINHSTRDGASDNDEKFLMDYCLSRKIIFHSKKLDYSSLSKGNFQQNARMARYQFFDDVMTSQSIDLLATAHHMDDRWETFIMNLNRKSGLKGLTSLKARRNNIIRPLLNVRKLKIEKFAKVYNIPFAFDISNDSDDYTRNKIRHHISPSIEKIFPNFIPYANEAINNLSRSLNLIQELIQSSGIVIQDQITGYSHIQIQKIKNYDSIEDLAFEILSPYGYTQSAISDILDCSTTGAIFLTQTHEALYNRGTIILRKKEVHIQNHISVDDDKTYDLQDGRTLYWGKNPTENKCDIIIDHSSYLRKSAIIRSIQPGDRYYPSHMNGKSKTIKKHLNDLRIDRFTKTKILVIEIDQKIIDIIK